METKVRTPDGTEDWHSDCGVAIGEDGDLTVIAVPECDVEATYAPGAWTSVEVTA